MGNVGRKQKKITKLQKIDTLKYERLTNFTADEILMMHEAYREECLSDGTVDEERFVELFSIYNKTAKALRFLDHLFRTWDFEKHGNLTFDDLLRALSVTNRGTKEQRCEYLFYLYDVDHSGEITIDEFSNLQKIRLSITELTNLEDIFRKIDADGNGTVDFEEFVSACSNNSSLVEYLDLY